VPVAVGELIEDCLAFEPAHRPTPQQVAERLAPLLGALPRPRLAGIKLSMRSAGSPSTTSSTTRSTRGAG